MDSQTITPDRVALVFCSHDRVHAGFAYDYGHLIGQVVATQGYIPELQKHFALSLNWCQTSILPEGRHRLVEDLYEKKIEKILWIDTDMRVPKETFHMLLRHDEPIVGVNYVSRRPPFRFTAATLDNRPLETRPGDTGLVEVGHVGFGACLTDMSVFGDPTGFQPPMFSFEWFRDPDDNRWKIIGEDVSFCREARARGFKIYVDQELSAAVGHTGEFIFTADEMARIDAVETVT